MHEGRGEGVLWILCRIVPCKKYDMDSHRNSMTIPCHLSRFYVVSMPDNDMDFGQVQVMEFPWHLLKKWWDFPCGFGLIFKPDQTAVNMAWDKIPDTFFTGILLWTYIDTCKSLENFRRVLFSHPIINVASHGWERKTKPILILHAYCSSWLNLSIKFEVCTFKV